MPEKQQLKLIEKTKLSESTFHLSFKCENPVNFIPGQFITFLFTDQSGVKRRNYSIANYPGSDIIDVAASLVPGGFASEIFRKLEIGEELNAMLPFGQFILKTPPKRYILVATGTGITPYRSMLPDLLKLAEQQGTKVEIFMGARKAEDLIYKEDLDQAANNKLVNVTYCLSKENISNYYYGRVSSLLRSFDLDPNGDQVYLCGNPNMVDELYTFLKDLGFTNLNAKREKYISAK